MVVESLKIKNTSYYFWNDLKFVKVVRQESRIGVDTYYSGYIVNKPQYNIGSVNPLYLIIRNLVGRIEK